MMAGRSLRRPRRFRVPKGFALSVPDPITAAPARARALLAIGLTLLAHGTVLALALLGRDEVVPPKEATPTLPLIVATRPAPSPPPANPAPTPLAAPLPRTPRRRPTAAPAQAAAVVVQHPAADAPVDLTDFTLAVGTAAAFAGGQTSAAGTSRTAVPGDSLVDVTAAAAPSPRSDRSRPASPARQSWSCAWPDEEADTDSRDARVVIRVTVDRDGQPQSVAALSAPKPSFAEAARRCALSESYLPALDALGVRSAGSTKAFAVHFYR